MASAQIPVIPRISGLICQLGREEYEALRMVGWAAMPPPGDSAHGLGHSAMCSEFNTYTEVEIVFDGRFPNFEESLADMSWRHRALIENCATWKVESIASRTRKPVESDVPTRLLAGELDSVTPPSWARGS